MARHTSPLSRGLRGLLVIVFLVLTGCGPEEYDDPEAFQKAVMDPTGPFVRTVDHDHVTVRLRYAPPDAMKAQAYERLLRVEQRLKQRGSLSDTASSIRWKQTRDLYRQAQSRAAESIHFYMKIEPAEGDLIYQRLREQGYGAYSQWLQDLAFRLEPKVRLQVAGGPEVPLSVYRMERTFAQTRSRRFILAFPATLDGVALRDREVTLVVDEFGLDVGTIRADFDLADLTNRVALRPIRK